MASDKYKPVLLYLHKEHDRDIIEHLDGLPRWLRQDFARNALRDYLPSSGRASRADGAPAAKPPGIQIFGDSDSV
ncbi:MAG: hypothetical protein ABSD38_10615 [Syntrophorhabdales bacterium]|jgi:hypothetical protein